jgi:hypothetical protein
VKSVAVVRQALKPLAEIWEAYQANNLDDEARRFWGVNLEHENTLSLDDITLYSGRGGKVLLSLEDCRLAWEALH